jgi:protein subunit release factor B
MIPFNVSAHREREFKKRMGELGVSEEDLEEKFIRSSGPGGQKASKTSTCVFLRHMPTDIVVKYQRERSQALNRFLARERLLDLVEKRQKGFILKEKSEKEKIRRQKRRRSRRAKEKMLEAKCKQSEKKKLRSPIKISSPEE